MYIIKLFIFRRSKETRRKSTKDTSRHSSSLKSHAKFVLRKGRRENVKVSGVLWTYRYVAYYRRQTMSRWVNEGEC